MDQIDTQPVTPAAGAPSAAKAQSIARIVLASALGLLGLWVVSGFVPALVWALVIAVAVDPLLLRLRALRPGLAASRVTIPALITLVVALLVLVPIVVGIAQAAREAQDVMTWIASARANGVPVPGWINQVPFASDTLKHWWEANLATPESAALQIRTLSGAAWHDHSQLIGKGLLHRSVIFAFTLLTLFFLLRDRDSIVAQAERAGDLLFGPAGERIGVQAIRSVRGTIDGLVLVGIGEGAVMTIVYVMLGVPHPILLGALTAVAAMIPFGAALMFAIAALLLLGLNSVGSAIAVVVIGLAVVAIADHFIRPVLIGGATRLPFVWVLIGILGGVETFGLLGLFVGPATMAVLILMWREYLDHSPDGGEAVSSTDVAGEVGQGQGA
ncbi:MAG: AI-2E family transporter [Sphingomonas sp.]